MKVWFLILYLWQSHNAHLGGPSLSVVYMPSRAACEIVGKAAKDLAKKAEPPASFLSINPHTFATHICIELTP